jgi:trehalose-6-phosphate synthase
LRARGQELSAQFEVRKDPRVPAALRDLNAQYTFLIEVRDKISAVNAATGHLRHVKRQVEAWSERDGIDPAVVDAARRAAAALERIEETLTQPKFTHETDRLKLPLGIDGKLAAVPEVVASADTAPTRQSREVYAKLAAAADAAMSDLEAVIEDEVAALNRAIGESAVPIIDPLPSWQG